MQSLKAASIIQVFLGDHGIEKWCHYTESRQFHLLGNNQADSNIQELWHFQQTEMWPNSLINAFRKAVSFALRPRCSSDFITCNSVPADQIAIIRSYHRVITQRSRLHSATKCASIIKCELCHRSLALTLESYWLEM